MSDFDERMAQLRARFVTRCDDLRGQLVIAAQAMDRNGLRSLAHGLSGTAGVFGFPKISFEAQAVEEGVDQGLEEAELRRLCSILSDSLSRVAQSD